MPWDVFAVGWITVGGGLVCLYAGTLIITKLHMLPTPWHQWLTLWGALDPEPRLWYGAYLLCIGGAMLLGGHALTHAYAYGWWLSFIGYVTACPAHVFVVAGSWDWGATSLAAMVLWFVLRARRCRAFSGGSLKRKA